MLNDIDGDQSSGSVSLSQGYEGIIPSSQLTVTGFTSKDAGVYSCVAVNRLGNDIDSRSFWVNGLGKADLIHYKEALSSNGILPSV